MNFLQFLRLNARWLIVGLLLSLSSSWGQTFFISIFAGNIRDQFGLSHGAWGGIYSLGTTISALIMIWGGGLTDRISVPVLSTIVLCGLAMACVAMAFVPGPITLIFVILALRFFGQGMSTHLAGVSMARWFAAQRGRALSIAMMGLPLGNATLPILFAALLGVFDWRILWLFAGGGALLGLLAVRGLLGHDRVPEGTTASESSPGLYQKHWTRREALLSPISWKMVPILVGPPAWGTALLFQQVHLTEIKGWALVDFVALFPLMTAISVVTTFVSGAAIDRIGAIRLVPILTIPWALSFIIFALSDNLGAAAVAMVLFGIATGLGSTLPIAFVAEVFGTRHVGSIKAVVAALMVLGSAIGPGITGVLIDAGVPFEMQLLGFVAFFLVGGILAHWASRQAIRALARPAQENVVRS